ncbi:acyltransferase family protein [Sphingomicrobium sediminis]|uniref:Acyltransferase n=1 Tax=Sphingomicrobium sediminis TaxID=2950949 RepID=A0A9X2J3R8_9SPHN|nr:acyltransferase family protein [Sphingomicrobium sediminis]MCM8557606.1 acyltransferase [Sphingomicrobium sediminis]
MGVEGFAGDLEGRGRVGSAPAPFRLAYRPEIDGLRAIAVLPVMAFHAGFEAFGGGFVGVDIFFVISGYLITSILVGEMEAGRFSLTHFYERRARRILPALAAMILACIPFAWAWMTPAEFDAFARSMMAVGLFLSNLHFENESGYFDAVAEEKPLLHTWSLAVEEQFYVIFPIALLALWRFGPKRVGWTLLGIALASLAYSEWLQPRDGSANFFLAPSRAWELLAGSICALLIRERGIGKNDALALVGIVAIVASILFYDAGTPFPGKAALLPVGGTVLLILFAGQGNRVGKLLSHRWLVGVGLISYSAYLWHQPLFAFARIRSLGAPDPLLMAGLLVAALGLAALSWHVIERPFRDKKAMPARVLWRWAAVLLALPLVLGMVADKGDGFAAARTEPWQRDFLATATPSPLRGDCHAGDDNPISYADSCVIGEGEPTLAVLGDSHGVEPAFALGQQVAVRQLTYSDCPPLYGTSLEGREACGVWTQQVVDALVTDEAVQTVLVAYRLPYHLAGEVAGHYPAQPADKDRLSRTAMYEASLGDTVARLRAAGKRVILLLPPPELPKHVDALVMRAEGAEVSGVPQRWWEERMASTRRLVTALPSGITVIDPSTWLCDDTQCSATLDGKAQYFDDDHLSIAGASRVADAVTAAL